jgi:O-antigen/teichoic acid export membrane protein
MNYKIAKEFLLKQKFNLIFFEQLVTSGTSFVATILIINLIGLNSFGIFSMYWIFYLLINSLQNSLIISPMMTNIAFYEENEKMLFIGSVLLQQIFFLLFFIIFIKIIFTIPFIDIEFIKKDYINYFILLILSSQVYQFFRRYFFSQKMYFYSLFTSIFVGLTLIGSLFYYYYSNQINIKEIFSCYIFSFSITVLLCIFSLRNFKFSIFFFKTTIKENFKISKWLFLTSILQWFSGNLWIINSGLILGPTFLGAFRACQTIVNVVNVFFQSLENYFPKKISEIYKNNSIYHMKKYINTINKIGFMFILVISIILSFFSKFILNLFYEENIVSYYYLLIILSFLLPFMFINFFYSFGLRTLKNTKPIFFSYLFSSSFTLIFSNKIILNYEIEGFILGFILTQFFISIITYLGFYLSYRSTKL